MYDRIQADLKPWRYLKEKKGSQALIDAVDAYLDDTTRFQEHTNIHTIPPQVEGEGNILIDRLPDNGLAPRIFTLMRDVSVVLPDGIRFGYEWGGRTIAFNTIGDPALMFDRQEACNTRYSPNK